MNAPFDATAIAQNAVKHAEQAASGVLTPPPIVPISAAELLRMDLPIRETLMTPWLPAKGAALLYAPRGVGKTYLAMSVAYAVAGGGTLLGWAADRPRRVLYADGEMPLVSLQERLAGIVSGARYDPPPDDFLRFLPADFYRDGLPDLASAEGRALLEQHTDGVDLVVFDNLSSLIRAPENEADGWQGMQDLVLSLRRRETSALLIHHAGKGGDQRGTSRREDVMATVISLKRSDDYDPKRGAQFEVHFTKARGFTGADASPFVATLDKAADGALTWQRSDIGIDQRGAAFGMFASGQKAADVWTPLGVSRATAFRWHKEWKDGGGNV